MNQFNDTDGKDKDDEGGDDMQNKDNEDNDTVSEPLGKSNEDKDKKRIIH